MTTESILTEIGLSDGETKVYLALLKLGSSPVSAIKEETRLHRTTIYDFIEKLLNKGLISYVIKNNTKYFDATHPDKLLDFLKKKQEDVKDILPDLINLTKFQKQDIKVEVYKGIEGYRTISNKMIKVGKEVISFGIDETKFEQMDPIFMKQFFRQEQEQGIKERALTVKDPEFVYNYPHIRYKFIPKEYFSPIPTFIFGDNVAVVIWEPLTTILIENKDLADAYRKHFELLWNQNIKMYKGMKETMKAYSDLYDEVEKGTEYYLCVPKESEVMWDYYDYLVNHMIKNGFKVNIIIGNDAKRSIGYFKKRKQLNSCIVDHKLLRPFESEVLGDCIITTLWKKEPAMTVIKDKESAKVYKKYFKFLFNIGKKQ